MSENLFEMPGTAVATTEQRKQASYRLELYDNGPNCRRPITQYGLVLDCQGSKERYNFNFGLVADTELANMAGAPTTSLNGYQNIIAMMRRWIDNDYCVMPNAHVTSAKKNRLAGTGKHDLRAGARSFHHEVGAILIYNGSRAPEVHLFINGEEAVIDGIWEPVTSSSHPAKRWQAFI